MPTYRVFGDLNKVYYTDVQASDRNEAYDIANEIQTNDWSEVEADYIIEVFNVEEYDQELGVPTETPITTE